MTATQPFEELSDGQVQHNYCRGIFPDDVFSMPMGPFILACWSLEFWKEMEKLRKFIRIANRLLYLKLIFQRSL